MNHVLIIVGMLLIVIVTYVNPPLDTKVIGSYCIGIACIIAGYINFIIDAIKENK